MPNAAMEQQHFYSEVAVIKLLCPLINVVLKVSVIFSIVTAMEDANDRFGLLTN